MVSPSCAGADKGTLKQITNQTFSADGTYDCFDVTLTQALLKGDIIIPLIKSSTTGLVKFSTTLRFVQT